MKYFLLFCVTFLSCALMAQIPNNQEGKPYWENNDMMHAALIYVDGKEVLAKWMYLQEKGEIKSKFTYTVEIDSATKAPILPVGFGSETHTQNNLNMSAALVDVYGKKKITTWLRDGIYITFSCEIDTLGNVVKIIRYRSSKIVLTEKELAKITKSLNKKKLTLKLSYLEPELSLEEYAPHILHGLMVRIERKEPLITNAVGFPMQNWTRYKKDGELNLKGFFSLFKNNIKTANKKRKGEEHSRANKR